MLPNIEDTQKKRITNGTLRIAQNATIIFQCSTFNQIIEFNKNMNLHEHFSTI
jgi:hypothetical protein